MNATAANGNRRELAGQYATVSGMSGYFIIVDVTMTDIHVKHINVDRHHGVLRITPDRTAQVLAFPRVDVTLVHPSNVTI